MIVAVVQARMTSTRMPGKVLAPLAGAPAIARLLERARRAASIDALVVATSVDASDDPLVAVCELRGVRTVRGSLDDVLARTVRAVPDECDTVVRLTGDCPLLDPHLVDAHVRTFLQHRPAVGYVSNAVERTYPDGLDVEVFSAALLRDADRHATSPHDREHVTPWIQRHTAPMTLTQPCDLSALRWTLDTPADYDVLAAIYDRLYPDNTAFTTHDVYRLLVDEPSLLHVAGDAPDRAAWVARLREQLGSGRASRQRYERARQLIPGGTQLLSKRPETFLPGQWPAYYRTARGVTVEDLDGRAYVDVTHHAVGACPLGYADPDVDRAVAAAVRGGSMATLNCPEEVELAEQLCELHPWAAKVRYARTGGEAMAMAVRFARAATGRDTVAFSGYHGWHDWYLAANLADGGALDGHLLPHIDPRGVPRALRGSVVPFAHGDVAGIEAVVAEHGDALAAIVLEPARYAAPPDGYLAHVRALADRHGIALVFDEITTGFRLHLGGLHQRLGVAPDLAVFAKAMSNGYAMAAVIGRDDVMEAAQRTFVSSTYFSERVGPAAALATIRKLAERDVPAHLAARGDQMRRGWERLAVAHNLEIATKGLAPLPSFALCHAGDTAALATLYTQRMLEQGFLASAAFYPSYAHTPGIVDRALEATDRAFAALRDALDSGDVAAALHGPVAHNGLRPRGTR